MESLPMTFDRRRLLALTAATTGAAAAVTSARAAPASTPISALGLDATQFGLRSGSLDDQSRTLQRAVDETARTRTPLAIPPGNYRVGGLKLAPGTQLLGVRGATRLVLTEGPSLISGAGADHVTLMGLVIDGGRRPLPERSGLVQLENCRSLKVADCEITGSGRNGIMGIAINGEIIDTTLTETADVAIHALDSRGLTIARNSINGAGNNGIQIWRQAKGDDGTIVVDNRIENIDNRSGGSGQYGNAINVFRAANVIVRGNRIKNCAFTAVRGNAASNLHIEGNSINDAREVALYAEFGFEGALIASNTIDGAAIGVSVTNFNEGGRLAVVQGNIIRNLLPRRPHGTDPGDSGGVGISVEADSAVTGNVVENAPTAGIMLGWGQYLRDVAVTGNVVRIADIGIAVSVAPGAGSALIANNVIAEARRGAIVGMARSKPVTGDLAKGGVEQYANLSVSGNRVR
jgi:uncharacterized secreted repeat protein (TIGR03808 family)